MKTSTTLQSCIGYMRPAECKEMGIVIAQRIAPLHFLHTPSNLFLDNLHCIRHWHDTALFLGTQLEFDATILQRAFTHHSSYGQTHQVGIVELDARRLGAVVVEYLDTCGY